MRVLAVCTGNVARSAMLGYMLSALSESQGWAWSVRTAGTHVTEGSTMSSRTRDALVGIEELGDARFGAHRSRQLTPEDLAWADVVLTAEADHVRFARALAPGCADRVVLIRQFVERAPAGAALARQLAAVTSQEPDATLDVPDPAGADQAAYDDVARSLWRLAQAFASLVAPRN